MKAKIMLLPDSAAGEMMCRIAEEILTDISVSFGHTFSILRDKIGMYSVHAYETPLTEETVDACVDADCAFIGRADCEGADVLCGSLRIPCKKRAFYVPNGTLYIYCTSALDAQTLSDTMQQCFKLAQEENLPISYILPNGKTSIDFKAAITSRTSYFPDVEALEKSAPEAIAELISAPRPGIMVCPPYAGSIMLAAMTALTDTPMMLFDACEGNGGYVYSPVLPDSPLNGEEYNPTGTALAVASMLRNALRLNREADCVESAVKNILEAGWRTPDMPGDLAPIGTGKMMQLIAEQINVAGQLMHP